MKGEHAYERTLMHISLNSSRLSAPVVDGGED